MPKEGIIIFIDESGIHRPIGHSVFAFVFVKLEEMAAVEKQILSAEQRLGIAKFHWAETSWPVKAKFFQEVIGLPFWYLTKVFINPIKSDVYLEKAALSLLEKLSFDSLYVDGAKPRWYASRLKRILRDHGISVNKVKMISDSRSAGLRLADMVAGLVRAHADGSTRLELHKMYTKLVKNKPPLREVR